MNHVLSQPADAGDTRDEEEELKGGGSHQITTSGLGLAARNSKFSLGLVPLGL